MNATASAAVARVPEPIPSKWVMDCKLDKIYSMSIAMLYRLPGIKKRYARFLEAQADTRFLLNGAKRSLRA